VPQEEILAEAKEKLGIKAKDREVTGADSRYILKEAPMSYKTILWQEND